MHKLARVALRDFVSMLGGGTVDQGWLHTAYSNGRALPRRSRMKTPRTVVTALAADVESVRLPVSNPQVCNQ